MPRIDPIQLLKCLSVLLSPNGGIRSNDEVHRLASLMTKFSKKLVSKCIYIQILKCTETKLLGSFMGSGGWRLAHMWLTESIAAKNWPLVRELLELLLLCPVDIDRLKTNNCPKLVKELSKDGSQSAIRALAEKLVEQWLRTVKGEPVIPVSESDFPQIIAQGLNFSSNDSSGNDLVTEIPNIKEDPDKKVTNCNIESVSEETMIKNDAETTPLPFEIAYIKEENVKEEALPILKISLKDGKQFISKIDDGNEDKNEKYSSEKDKDHKSSKIKNKHDSKSSRSSNKHSSSSRSHSSKSSSDKNKSNSKISSNSSSNRDKHKDSNRHSSSTEKHKDKKTSDKSHVSSSKSKIEKTKSEKLHKSDKQKDERTHKNRSKTISEKEISKENNEKNNDLPIKLQPSISKLMKIPKIGEAVKKETPSISIESRKPNDPNRPKTVKTFHSKFRSHGLEEEAKPPPPRGSVLKKTPTVLQTVTIPKRPSPSHSIEQPPEKKSKITEPQEKPGSIKLIPAKPKHITGASEPSKLKYEVSNFVRLVGKLQGHHYKST